MKKSFGLFCLLLLLVSIGLAQNGNKYPPIDKSPMDMSYYPANYPVLKIQDRITEPLVARVLYSRPQQNGRVIFGDLVEYGQVWRLGANESTEIELFRDVKVADKKLKKGRYTLYAIPTEKKWTLIFNKDTDSWGAFKYDEKKDILRVDINVEKLPDPVDIFTMYFEKASYGAQLIIAWENARALVPFQF